MNDCLLEYGASWIRAKVGDLMATYGLPDGPMVDPEQEDYFRGFIDEISSFVRDRRANGWFYGKDDMLSYYRDRWSEKQNFVADVLWDLSLIEESFDE
jgi:hypothetical protein